MLWSRNGSHHSPSRQSDAGAKFIVTPGYNPEVVDYRVGKGVPDCSGCMDTNAIEMALSAGLDTVKFFQPNKQVV